MNRSIPRVFIQQFGNVLRLWYFHELCFCLCSDKDEETVGSDCSIDGGWNLTANAAIVQSRVGYTDAYKYHDAVLQLKELSIQFVLTIQISTVSIRHLT